MNHKENHAKYTCASCNKCKRHASDETYLTIENANHEETRKILVEIPSILIKELKILASDPNSKPISYVLFAEKLSDSVRIDGYTRISQSCDYTSYDIDEVIRLVKAGRFPVLMLHVRKGRMRPSPKETMTWWMNDHALGFPLNHALLSVEKEDIEFEVYSLKECFFCERKSEPLKNLELGW